MMNPDLSIALPGELLDLAADLILCEEIERRDAPTEELTCEFLTIDPNDDLPY